MLLTVVPLSLCLLTSLLRQPFLLCFMNLYSWTHLFPWYLALKLCPWGCSSDVLNRKSLNSVKLRCLWVSPQTEIQVFLRFINLFTGTSSCHKNPNHPLLSLSRTTGTQWLHDIFKENSL